MTFILYILANTVSIALSILMFAMLGRAILSFLPFEDSPLGAFLAMITEPVIYPVRCLFEKLNIGVGFPLDIPFFVTYMILAVLSAVL